jgi:hypothetical protein
MSRLVFGLVAGTFLLCLAAPVVSPDTSATAQTVRESAQVFETDAVVDPRAEAEPGTDPETPPDAGVEAEGDEGDLLDGEPPSADLDGNTPNTTLQTPGYGNAADQSPQDKQAEIERVEQACKDARPPTSKMLGLPGFAGGDQEGSWGWLLIAVAVTLLAIAAIGIVLGRRRSKGSPIGPLSATAAVVGIVSAVAGLAVQFIPGVGVSERPPSEATMEVRQVHPRITRGEYATKTATDVPINDRDWREVGNVVWVEIQARGYEDKKPFLQYALYDPDAAGALLPGTAKRIALRPRDQDVQTLFVPIWVGYPKSKFFEAQFRLLDGERVQQMASTGRMPGSTYRYSC